MHDVKWIRENSDAFDRALARRSLDPMSAEIVARDKARRQAQTDAQGIQSERNRFSKEIGLAKASGEDASALIAKVSTLKERLAVAEDAVRSRDAALDEVLEGIPNLPADDVPEGEDEAANVELRQVGERPDFDFEPRQHFEIGAARGEMDFAAAAKLSGARFVVLKGRLARLERAIASFMLDLQTEEFGYTEVSPPVLVRDAAAFGTGQLPKFADDLFVTRNLNEEKLREFLVERTRAIAATAADIVNKGNDEAYLPVTWTADEILKADPDILESVSEDILQSLRAETSAEYFSNLWLIPTAEVPLTNLVAGDILDEGQLPLRYAAHTACFRAEAGAAGKDTRGMLRQHQFYKVELVSITHPEHSEDEHERMTACAEEVLKRLGLPYRVVVLSTGDMGFAARKTYDIEAWLPGQDAYREISSCSNCGDFQARRMNARFRPKGGKGTRFVHTLNGSGLAVGRTMIAVLENYQQADGSIVIPEALRPYMGGLKAITADV